MDELAPADVDTHVEARLAPLPDFRKKTRSPGWSSLIETEVPLLI